MSGQFKVTFTATYTALVNVDETDDETLVSQIQNLEMPEGGDNNVRYVKDSFDIIEVTDPDGNKVPQEEYELELEMPNETEINSPKTNPCLEYWEVRKVGWDDYSGAEKTYLTINFSTQIDAETYCQNNKEGTYKIERKTLLIYKDTTDYEVNNLEKIKSRLLSKLTAIEKLSLDIK